MTHRRVRALAAPLALLLLAGPAIAACSSAENFAELEPTKYERNVPLSTTTIITATVPPAPSTTRPNLQGSVNGVAKGGDAALVALVGRLAGDPAVIGAIGQLTSAEPANLASVLGLDTSVTEQLELTLAELQGLAALVAATDLPSLANAAGAALGESLESIDLSAVHGLVALAGQIDGAALALADALTQQVVRTVVDSVVRATQLVDPELVRLLVWLLDMAGADGLGSLSSDPSSAAVLAVLAGATLQTQPEVGQALRPATVQEPRLAELLERLGRLGGALEPAEAAALAAIASQISPEGVVALSQLVDTVGDPDVQDLLARLR